MTYRSMDFKIAKPKAPEVLHVHSFLTVKQLMCVIPMWINGIRAMQKVEILVKWVAAVAMMNLSMTFPPNQHICI